MTELEKHGDLKTYLRSCVRSIRKDRPHMNSSRVASKLGIPIATLSRIANGQGNRPTFTYALRIVREACGNQNVKAFMEKFYPEMIANFAESYPNNQQFSFVDLKAEAYFADPSSYELMLLISSGNGVNRSEVLAELGRKGVKTLDKLISKGILCEENNRIVIKGKINAGQETVHKLLKNLVTQSYSPEYFGRPGNWLSVQYEAVNKEKAWPIIREIIIEANQKIKEVFASPNLQGNDIVWVGLVADSLQRTNNQATIHEGELS